MRRYRSEAGETLIESLIAAVLLATVVVAIVGGVGTTVVGAHVHRSQTNANVVLTSAMERIKSSDFEFANVDCSVASPSRLSNYQNEARAVSPLPAGWVPSQITVSSVTFQTIDTSSGTPTVTFGTTCVAAFNRQLVTLQVTSPDGKATSSLSFVKGDI